VEIDPDFALAFSIIACAYSFAKEKEKEIEYFEKAKKFEKRFTGFSKEALLFKGNVALAKNPAQAELNYRLITELYPDDRDGFLYYGLYFAYVRNDQKKAIELYEKAKLLSPGYFPIYRDLAYSTVKLQGKNSAIVILKDYIENYPENYGAKPARQMILELASWQ